MNEKKLQELKDVQHLIADVIKHLKRDKTYGGYLATSNASLALHLVDSMLEEIEWCMTIKCNFCGEFLTDESIETGRTKHRKTMHGIDEYMCEKCIKRAQPKKLGIDRIAFSKLGGGYIYGED